MISLIQIPEKISEVKKHNTLTGILKIPELGRERLDQSLSKLFPNYSRSQIKLSILSGQVRVNNQIITVPKKRVFGGEFVQIQFFIVEEIHWKPQKIKINIIYEDNDILVINKPYNLVVHPGAGNNDGTLLNALLNHFPPIKEVPRAGIVHRLDKNTTGLMVIAKNALSQVRLKKLIQERNFIREYDAIVIGTMTAGGIIRDPILRHFKKRIKMTISPFGKPAITHYRITERFRTHTRLRIRLDTGRTHQIRLHMSHINHPIVGDSIYGGSFQFIKKTSTSFNNVFRNFNRQALHSTMLRLSHPITFVNMEWNAPLPQDMNMLIHELNIDTEQYKNKLFFKKIQ